MEAEPDGEKLDLRFQKLWSSYPSDQPYVDAKGNPPKGYENQCAIKVSVALRGCGVELRGFKGATVQVGVERHAIRAQELAAWLQTDSPRRLRSRRRVVTGADWEEKCAGKTGILYFEDYWLREGERSPSGDHIDLWNGSRLTASGFSGAVVSILRFGLGVSSGPGFSDLGKAKKIVMWEVD
jgi:Type VI secretion system (T6SS), amidase effector protein 4